jgi:hypothetical protein
MQNFSFIFCCGFPKCGTTTIAALLDCFDECSLHMLKEPNYFLENRAITPSYLDQFPDKTAKYLVDFSTFYGLRSKRSQVLANMTAAGAMDKARFIVCIRNPVEQAASYLKHISIRRRDRPSSMQFALEEAQDFRGCIEDLLSHSNHQGAFIIKFEELQSQEQQHRLLNQLGMWLGLAELTAPPKPLKLNAVDDYAEYSGGTQKIVGLIKKLGLGKFLTLQQRQALRNRFGVKKTGYVFTPADLAILGALDYRDALGFYSAVTTGPIGDSTVYSGSAEQP